MKLDEQRGLTFVELLVSLAIIALLSATATMGLASLLDSLKDRRAVAVVVGAIREAQVRAMQESRPYGVQFAPLALIQGSLTADPLDCTNVADWSIERDYQGKMPSGVAIDDEFMGECLAFKASGSPPWQAFVNMNATTSAHYPTELVRLLDGVKLKVKPGGSIISNGAVTTFRNTADPPPVIQIDLGRSRYLNKIGIGLITCTTGCGTVVKYPSAVRVRVSIEENPDPAVSGDWVDPNPPSQSVPEASTAWERSTFYASVPAGEYRTVEITLTKRTTYTVLDELDVGVPHVVLNGRTGNWRVSVAQVTGRVQAEKME